MALPAGAARHVQVLRMQPGETITLFHGGLGAPEGPGGEFDATITHMGRSEVRVQVGAHHAIEREAGRAVHLLAGITANERMDWLVEKATELGVASITPLLAERSVLKLKGERADKKQAHWQAIAIAACEQCGRNRVPDIAAPADVRAWLADRPAARAGLVLAPDGNRALAELAAPEGELDVLIGPEGGFTPAELELAVQKGIVAVRLGPRILRAETAALAALAAVNVLWSEG